MALSQKIELKIGQSLVMTPQLMQAIKLLQLSNLDLADYVEEELEKNPLLERAEPENERIQPDEPPSDIASTATISEDSQEGDWLPDSTETSRDAIEDRMDTSIDNVFPDDAGPVTQHADASQDSYLSSWNSVGGGGRDDDDFSMDSLRAADISLRDHLDQQLGLVVEVPADRLIAQMIIDSIDDTGYLTVTIDDIAEKIGAQTVEIERVLRLVQTMEPSGVGARNLAECLAIQLREKDRYDPAMQLLVENLELLARRDLSALRRLCKVDEDDLADMIAEIRQLNPKPGLAFGGAPIQPVVPDVLVRASSDGGWLIELNAETLPRILINQSYFAKVTKKDLPEADRNFLSEAMQTATWLTRALDQRARTIIKVASEIIRQQDSFLALGVAYLRPLNLKTVADAVGMHESTISRVTANKFMATPRGVFELKYFFTSAIGNSDGGESHSAESVRYKIKQMIDAESSDDILSDDTLVDMLRKQGVDIARRTVAKYREAMRIPSSVQRRREKQNPR
jgi:RNA polymerase sigma-54 factor